MRWSPTRLDDVIGLQRGDGRRGGKRGMDGRMDGEGGGRE